MFVFFRLFWSWLNFMSLKLPTRCFVRLTQWSCWSRPSPIDTSIWKTCWLGPILIPVRYFMTKLFSIHKHDTGYALYRRCSLFSLFLKFFSLWKVSFAISVHLQISLSHFPSPLNTLNKWLKFHTCLLSLSLLCNSYLGLPPFAHC